MSYTRGTIEFLTVATEVCRFLQQSSEGNLSSGDFTDKSIKLLPLLYLKATLIPDVEAESDEALESFTDETQYEAVREGIAALLGEDDSYLSAFHPDMALSETAVAAFISEDMADLYQSLNDFVGRCQIGDEALMNDALALCVDDFRTYWGDRLLSALHALHRLYCEKKLNNNE